MHARRISGRSGVVAHLLEHVTLCVMREALPQSTREMCVALPLELTYHQNVRLCDPPWREGRAAFDDDCTDHGKRCLSPPGESPTSASFGQSSGAFSHSPECTLSTHAGYISSR